MILAETPVVEAEPRRLAWPWIEAVTSTGSRARVYAAAAPRQLLSCARQLLLSQAGLTGLRLAAVVDRSGAVVPLDHRLLEAAFPRVAARLYGDPDPLVERERWVNGTRVDYLVSTSRGLVLVEHKTLAHTGPGEPAYPRTPSQRLQRQLEVLWRAAEALEARAELVVAVASPSAKRLLLTGDPVARRLLRAHPERLGARAYRVEALLENRRLVLLYRGEIAVQL
ncbi:DNA/RNA nuclease SfsA [Pyrodictium abyssi]|uniref:Sugar fermentation stimulation protein C-terminal domain-containing protein n=1 Tax=Pyrodictium abyssi TaxID=54256 RepID=A0ABM8ITK9_9CREN|nr:hypothetical protein PABY_04680 [Pyrodictium abyssi]